MKRVDYMVPYSKGKYGEIKLSLPRTWTVETIKRTGRLMENEEIYNVIANPIGSPTLSELASSVKKVGIILEDHTRFTPLKVAFEIVLKELFHAGIEPENITLIGASATHRSTRVEEIAQKVGPESIRGIRIIEHNVLDEKMLVFLGNTSYGTPVWINSEIASCDLIIGMGGIAPHGSVQFGGGAKLLVPGIAGYETIRYNHTKIDQECTFKGDSIRLMRLDMEEAARMVNYAFNVSGFIDHQGTLVDMVAGDPIAAHREGMKKGKELYCVLVQEKADVVIACSNPLDVDCFQAIKGLLPAVEFVKTGGTILWLAECSEGIGTHMLTQMDDEYRQAMIRGMQERCMVANVIFYSNNLSNKEIYEYIAPEIIFYNDLDNAVNKLIELAPEKASVKILTASPFTVGI
jgi:nickel-dependent lactate racemase